MDEASDDYTRQLGVIEAFTVITRQCPNGAVRAAAQSALDAVRTGGSDALRSQAYFVLTAIRGWRGARAEQVHRSLSAFLESASPSEPREDDGD